MGLICKRKDLGCKKNQQFSNLETKSIKNYWRLSLSRNANYPGCSECTNEVS